MLKRVFVDNFRCLVNFELPVGELMLLTGSNGCGKSTLFEVVQRIRDLVSGDNKPVSAFPPSSRTRWTTSTQQVFELDLTTAVDDLVTYRLVLDHYSRGRVKVAAEYLVAGDKRPLFTFRNGEVRLYRDDHSEGPVYTFDWHQSALAATVAGHDNTRLTAFKQQLSRFIIAGLQPAAMEAESQGEVTLLARDGSNFSSWFRFISQEYQDRIPDLTRRLKEVLPGFHGFRLAQAGSEVKILMVGFDDGGTTNQYRFDELSDGQRSLIAIYTLVFGLHGLGYCLFLDEPENYVTLPEIQPWLVELKDACGDGISQAILISHHPELINYLGMECGMNITRSPGCGSRVKVLAEQLRPAADNGLPIAELVARGWAP